MKCWVMVMRNTELPCCEMLSHGVMKCWVTVQSQEMLIYCLEKCWLTMMWNADLWCREKKCWFMVTWNAKSWCRGWNACSRWYGMLSHHHRNGISLGHECWVMGIRMLIHGNDNAEWTNFWLWSLAVTQLHSCRAKAKTKAIHKQMNGAIFC